MASRPRSSFWVGPARARIFFYLETHNPRSFPIVLGSHNLEVLMARAERSFRGDFDLVAVDLDRITFYLALRGFKILGEDESTRSGDEHASHAVYLAQRDLGDRGVLVQKMWANAYASRHHHGKKSEKFDPVLGCPTVKLGNPKFTDGETEVRLSESLFVPAGVSHQLVTGETPALNIIEVVGPNALGMDDYAYE
ncbi:MAG: hypothetical protein Q8O75_01100 [bacterium]|nr:hypothetical protein [bacterium]